MSDQLKGDARPYISLAEQPQSQAESERRAITKSSGNKDRQEVDQEDTPRCVGTGVVARSQVG